MPCLSVPTTIFSMSCDALDIAPPADHVLRAAELDQPPAHVVVAVPDRLDHGGDRDVVGQQLVGIEVDLVLLLESADRSHLGHAGNAIEAGSADTSPGNSAVGPGRSGRSCPPGRTGRPSPRSVASGPSSVLDAFGQAGRIFERYSSVRLRAQ